MSKKLAGIEHIVSVRGNAKRTSQKWFYYCKNQFMWLFSENMKNWDSVLSKPMLRFS